MPQVERLAKLLKVNESVAYTCETAGHFWLLHVLARWEKFTAQCAAAKTAECVQGASDACMRHVGCAVKTAPEYGQFSGAPCSQTYASPYLTLTLGPSCSAAELFPFAEYFSDAAQPLFKGERYEEDLERAQVRLAGAGGLCSAVCVRGGVGVERSYLWLWLSWHQ